MAEWENVARASHSRCVAQDSSGDGRKVVKRPWQKEEDEVVRRMVAEHGPRKWSLISTHLPGRVGKQCRERWQNHLCPDVKKDPWSLQEEDTLIRAHRCVFRPLLPAALLRAQPGQPRVLAEPNLALRVALRPRRGFILPITLVLAGLG